MKSGARIVASLVGLVVASVVGAGTAGAADPKAAEKIAALNLAAVAAHKSGNHEGAKTKLLEAVVLGKENGLGSDGAMARTYLHLGVVHAEGLKDAEKAVRYFGLALKVQPHIGVDATLNTKAVTVAMDKARAADTTAPKGSSEAAETAKSDLAEVERSIGKAPRAGKKAPAAAKPVEEVAKPAEAPKAPDAAKPAEAAKAAEAPRPVEAAKTAEAPKSEPVKPAASDAEKEKLLKEKGELEKQLAAARDGEKKEREAREKLQKEKAELEKQLAAVKDSGNKDREARAKLEQEKQVAAAKEQERRNQEEKARQEKAKLADGPELPAELPQPVFCPGLDERPAAADLYVHCAPQPKLQAKALALHYRFPGALDYTALPMESNRKGWFLAVIPAGKVAGKTLQYYVEARSADGKPVAANGKPKSPNIMMLLPAGTKVAAAEPAVTLAPTTPAPAAAESAVPAKRKKARARAARRRSARTPP